MYDNGGGGDGATNGTSTLLTVLGTPGDRLFSISKVLRGQCHDGILLLNADVSYHHQVTALLRKVNGKINGCSQGLNTTVHNPTVC